MIIGITGTQRGPTKEQHLALTRILSYFRRHGYDWLHHGDCIGVDAKAHEIAAFLNFKIGVHPPDNPSKRAFKDGDVIYPEKPYLQRNHHIVDVSQFMIAVPKGFEEERRSGTWATVRYASRTRKVLIVWPNGNDSIYEVIDAKRETI